MARNRRCLPTVRAGSRKKVLVEEGRQKNRRQLHWLIDVDCFLIGDRPARLWRDRLVQGPPSSSSSFTRAFLLVGVLAVAATMNQHHHKLLLNPGRTFKLSTDPLIAAVTQCLVPVEILVDLVEILVDLVLDGGKVPIGYRVNLTREVPVLNPRVAQNCIIREINTVFFPRDAPRLKK